MMLESADCMSLRDHVDNSGSDVDAYPGIGSVGLQQVRQGDTDVAAKC
jgi:hypothetical protein